MDNHEFAVPNIVIERFMGHLSPKAFYAVLILLHKNQRNIEIMRHFVVAGEPLGDMTVVIAELTDLGLVRVQNDIGDTPVISLIYEALSE